ncbi:MAG: ATP-binding protein [Lacunisphaera sp.]|nr:ATP-binding protein [Lacunisphaera sp.]
MNPVDRPPDGVCTAPPAAGVWARSETLTAVGRLAGGVAQDFNNLLTVINSNASLLLATEGLGPEALDSARRITAAGERAANLTRQLLLFSGEQPWHPRLLDLNARLREWTAALQRLAGPEINLQLELAEDAPQLDADAMMLEHLLSNLVANARDAMPGGGRLRLATSPMRITAADASRHPSGHAGDYLCLDVSDEGAGIAPEVLPHIFEPFFTTRPVGQGSGLGLAVAFGIVEMHGGWLEVDSAPGAGTRMRVFLPAAHAGATVTPAAEPVAFRGHETILLVEDDDLVRDTTAAVLKLSGYRVLQAESGAAALEVWQWHATRIALLLTDVVLPDGLSGLELATQLRTQQPGLKVICTSGFSREMMARLGRPPEGVVFLPKPCPPPALLKALRTLLESKTPAVTAP